MLLPPCIVDRINDYDTEFKAKMMKIIHNKILRHKKTTYYNLQRMFEIERALSIIRANYNDIKSTINEDNLKTFGQIESIDISKEITEYISINKQQIKRWLSLEVDTDLCVKRCCPHLRFISEMESEYYENQRSEYYCDLCGKCRSHLI